MNTIASRRLSVVRVALAAGVGLAVLMVLCWLGVFLPFGSPTHAYVALFTPAELNSVQALLEGTFWSLGFGLITGAVLATAYNLLAGLER